MSRNALLIALCLALPGLAAAEQIKIPVGQQGNLSAVSTPTLGMSKAMVEKAYGAPQQQFSAVGEPPISRWVYPEFTVYFEYNTVVHSVVRHTPKPE